MDFMPTFMEAAGAKYPKTYNGHNITPYTGISLLPAFEGKETQGHDALCNEHFNARYIRNGEWKLVSLSGDSSWRLYRTSQDETELNDLSAKYPDVVSRLAGQWRQWANTHQVFPKP